MSINGILQPNDLSLFIKKIAGLPFRNPEDAYPQTIHIDPATNLIARSANGAGNVNDIVLVGNPVHQFISGGSGTLDFRGLISPNNSILFNPTMLNIEMAVVDFYDPQITRILNVSPYADPDIANGSLDKPYANLQFALDKINSYGDATAESPYLVLLSPGQYTEGVLTLYPFIAIGSQSCNLVGTHITWVTLNIDNLDQPNSNFVFENITIDSEINVDTSSFANGLLMIFLHCNPTANITYTGNSSSVFVLKDGAINGNNISINGGLVFLNQNFTAFQTGDITLDNGIGVGLTCFLSGNYFSSRNVNINATNVGQQVNVMWNSQINVSGIFTVQNSADIILQIGAVPFQNNISSLTLPTLSRDNDCIANSFTPDTPSDWSPIPNNVKNALDILASNNYDLQLNKVIYVSPNADISTANGSPNNPYVTIQAAINVINGFGDASATEPYVVACYPGTYTEGTLTLHPFIAISSFSSDTVCYLTYTSLDISNMDIASSFFIFNNLIIDSVVTFDTTLFTHDPSFIFIGCTTNGNINYTGNNLAQLSVTNGFINGDDITILGGIVTIWDNRTSSSVGTIIVDNNISYGTTVKMTGNYFSGREIDVSATTIGNSVDVIFDTELATMISQNSSDIHLVLGQVPINNNIASLTLTVISRRVDCIGSAYFTTVPSLWPVIPNNVSTALDVLASSQWRIINDPGTAVLGFGGSGSTTTLGTSGITDMTLVGSGTTIIQGNTITSLQSTGGSVAVSAATTLTTTAGTNLVDNGNTITLNGTLSVSLTTPLLISGSTATTNFNRVNTVVNTGIIRLGGALDTNSMQINYGGPILLATPGPSTGIFIATSLLAAVASNASYKGKVSFQAVGTTITNIYSSYFTYVVASNGAAYVISYQNETDKYTTTAPVVTATLVISGSTNIAVQFTFNGFAQNLSLRFQNTFTRIA
jgi:hypothetical protein